MVQSFTILTVIHKKMSKTKADLKDLLASYKEAVLYWSSAFENAEEFSGIQAAKVNKPLDELLKLAC